MMKKAWLVWIVVAMVLLGSSAEAIELTVRDGQVNLGVQYTEPSVNANGTPLKDLYQCGGTIDLVGDGQPAQDWTIPARNGAGGETREAMLAFSVPAAKMDQITEAVATAWCEDATDPPNRSKTVTLREPVTLVEADTVPPASPTIKIIITVTVN